MMGREARLTRAQQRQGMAKQTIYSSIQAHIEELDGEWRAVQDSLGLTAYGATVEEASTRLTQALNLLLDTLFKTGGTAAVEERLNQAGLLFQISKPEEKVRRTLPLMLSLVKQLDPA
jgi:hypothetical protein